MTEKKKTLDPTAFTGKPSTEPCTLCDNEDEEQTIFYTFKHPTLKAVLCPPCFNQQLSIRLRRNGEEEDNNRPLSEPSDFAEPADLVEEDV